MHVNITSITLIPKKQNPNSLKKYRLTLVYKVIYKSISEIVANTCEECSNDYFQTLLTCENV